jgi:hypothetical protein
LAPWRSEFVAVAFVHLAVRGVLELIALLSTCGARSRYSALHSQVVTVLKPHVAGAKTCKAEAAAPPDAYHTRRRL